LSNEKIDRRVKYTKMVLRQSLLELMKDKNINKISVKDICDLADINRGTFYSHYADPFDLLHQIEEELFVKISASLKRHSERNREDKISGTRGAILEIIECIAENSDICRVLLSENGDPAFMERVMYIGRDGCIADWADEIGENNVEIAEFLYSFAAFGSISLIKEWFLDGMRLPPEEIARIVDQIIYRGLNSFTKKD